MSKTYVVVGAGFRGFCDAMQLLKKPGAQVVILDREPFFGGISHSATVKGFAVDKGVHMFDGIPQDLADIVAEIMDGQVRTVDFVSVSAYNGTLTEGFSLPDLSSLPEETKQRITRELKALAPTGGGTKPTRNLADHLDNRFGNTAGGIFAEIFRTIYNVRADEVQPDAISKTSLDRLKHLDDAAMLALKASDPWLDSVLAARRKSMAAPVDNFVSVYPDTGEAMRGWCLRAAEWLQKKGARICLGETVRSVESSGRKTVITTDKQRIEADHVVWTNDNTKALSNAMGFEFDASHLISGTPMLFAVLMTRARDIKDFTYLQNFDPGGITFRSASAGIYSNQIRNGISFITSECPAAIGSDDWNRADTIHTDIWEECKRLKVVSENAELADYLVIRLPHTFKVAKLGYDEKIREFNAEVARRNPRVVFRDPKPFFRREIYLDSFNLAGLPALAA